MTRSAEPPAPTTPQEVTPLVLPDLRRDRRRRRILLALLGVAAALGLYFAFGRGGEEVDRLRTEAVARGTVGRVITISAHLEVRERVEVPSPTQGRLASIDARPGDSVEAGQALAQLDDRRTELALGSARASMTAAASQVAAARATAVAAATELERLQALVDRGLASEADLAAARTRNEQASANFRAARAQQGVASTNVQSAQLGQELGVLVAPIAGMVLAAPRYVGALVGPERGPLFVIGSGLDTMRIEASVGEADVGELRVGQSAWFDVPAYPGRAFQATLTHVDPIAHIEPGATTYPVWFEAPNPDGVLLPGMTAVIRIEVARAENVLTVPEAALRFTPEGAPSAEPRTRVWIRLGPNRLEPVSVAAGVSDGAFTEVRPARANALSEGTAVAIGVQTAEEAGGAGLSLGGRRRANAR